jgi:hydroxyacylglutathione hydrolase
MSFDEQTDNPVITIPALGDNYMYLYRYGRNDAFAVDPGDSGAVLEALQEYRLRLTGVLVTHHHFDHTAGAEGLRTKTGCDITAADKAGAVGIVGIDVRAIATPGHTRDSTCYYVQSPGNRGRVLFTGDTLFIGGCGRPMGCGADTLWASLQKIAALPDDTLVYPGHDYTEENYEFALTIEPNNPDVRQRLDEIKRARGQGPAAVPSTMLQEKTTNVFLRAHRPEIKRALNIPGASDAAVFAELRRRKNLFG